VQEAFLATLIDKTVTIMLSQYLEAIDREDIMHTVTVSPKYQVVIPKNIRDAMHLRPGQKMKIMEYDGRIELIPDRDISELRGFLRGMDTEFEREDDRL